MVKRIIIFSAGLFLGLVLYFLFITSKPVCFYMASWPFISKDDCEPAILFYYR